MNDVLLPPWEALPDIPYPSIGWRMGDGQDYYNRFWIMFSGLTEIQKCGYEAKYPEPDDWRGKYDQIRVNSWSGE